MKKYIILDIETTGDEGGYNCPIQFSSIELNPDYKIVNTNNFSIIPDENILPSGICVHGLTLDKIKKNKNSIDIKTAAILLYDILNELNTKENIIIGYNHEKFDLEILNNTFKRFLDKTIEFKNTLDIIHVAKRLIPMPEIGGYKLDAVFTYLFPTKIDTMFKMRAKHDALNDCIITKAVLIGLLKKINKNKAEDLIELMKQPYIMNTFPFGKYKNQLFTEILEFDRQYLLWCYNNNDIMKSWPDLKFTLESIFKKTKK